MITKIGVISGEIITLLEQENNPLLTTDDIAVLLDEPREWVLMSVGWLLREGYLYVHGNNPKQVFIGLRPRKASEKQFHKTTLN